MRKHVWLLLVLFSMLDWLSYPAGANEVRSDAGQVLVNGEGVPNAMSSVEIEKEVIEFRDGGDGSTRLVPGPAMYRVCIESPGLVSAIELACAPDATNPYLDLTVEDGRSFSRCLVESSSTVNRRKARRSQRITRYCLRCEAPG